MDQPSTLIEQLRAVRHMRTRPEVETFDATVAELAELPVDELSKYLPALLRVFDDETEQLDVMWGLLHLVEDVPAEDLVRALAHTAPLMAIHAQEWLNLFLHRLLHSQPHRAYLRATLLRLPADDRSALRQALEVVRLEDKDAEVADVLR